MDENYQTYLNRAMRLTLPETYNSQVQHIQESAKFRPDPEQGRQAVPFPGYSIITPTTEDDPENSKLYNHLKLYQEKLVQQLGKQIFVPVPPASFHLTLADLIWDSAYRHASENPTFETQLRERVGQIFQQCQPLTDGSPIRFQVIGLMVMTRAIAVNLVPVEEYAYDRILKFRRALYQSQEIIGLGIEQQYYFTPHITLGYFGDIPPAQELPKLSVQFVDMNQHWLDLDPQEFIVHRAELRKFDDMTRYYRQPDWPLFKF